MNICVFCSSRSDFPEDTLDVCRQLGLWMGSEGHTLVYGGATVGLMGLMADSFLESKAHVIGILPEKLFATEIPHRGIQELIEVKDLMERKRLMMEKSQAFICLPGGVGSLDEIFEVITWKTLGRLDKPILIFNYKGFWDDLLLLLKNLKDKHVLGDEVINSYEVYSELGQLQTRIQELGIINAK